MFVTYQIGSEFQTERRDGDSVLWLCESVQAAGGVVLSVREA